MARELLQNIAVKSAKPKEKDYRLNAGVIFFNDNLCQLAGNPSWRLISKSLPDV